MREWQVGDPIGDGNDIGVPDIKYMDYLKNNDRNTSRRQNNIKSDDIKKSNMFQDEALKLNEENKFYDALTYINAAIRHNPDDDENWNIKGIILWNILETNDISVGYEAYDCFNRALEIKPHGKIIKKNKINFLYIWGIKLMDSGDLNQAMIRTNELLSIIEDKKSNFYANALALKAAIYMVTKNFDESLKYFDKALEINPIDIELRELKLKLLRRMADYYGEDLYPWDTRY